MRLSSHPHDLLLDLCPIVVMVVYLNPDSSWIWNMRPSEVPLATKEKVDLVEKHIDIIEIGDTMYLAFL